MNTTATSNNVAKHGHAAADKAIDAAPAIKKAVDQTQSFVRQSVKTVGAASRQMADTASQLTSSVRSYTKSNPMKAILIAAASGAVLFTVIRALTPSRD